MALKRLRERLEVTEREYGGAVTALETQLDSKVALVGELEVKLERREAQMEEVHAHTHTLSLSPFDVLTRSCAIMIARVRD